MLREAAAARRSTLAASANAAAEHDPHPALETIDEAAGSGAAAAAADGAVPAAGEGASVAPSMLPSPPPPPRDTPRQAHEAFLSVAPPPPPPKELLPAHTENSRPGEGGATPAGLVPPLPTPPAPVQQVPLARPPKNVLPPPPPPSKPAAAADACESITAVGGLQSPIPAADVHVQHGTTAALPGAVQAAGAEGETWAAAAVEFANGVVLEREYELEKVGVLPTESWVRICNSCALASSTMLRTRK